MKACLVTMKLSGRTGIGPIVHPENHLRVPMLFAKNDRCHKHPADEQSSQGALLHEHGRSGLVGVALSFPAPICVCRRRGRTVLRSRWKCLPARNRALGERGRFDIDANKTKRDQVSMPKDCVGSRVSGFGPVGACRCAQRRSSRLHRPAHQPVDQRCAILTKNPQARPHPVFDSSRTRDALFDRHTGSPTRR